MPATPNASSNPRADHRRDAPLPDHLKPGLRVLFVGINPGLRSAQTGHHYAGRGNRFWKLMYDSGLLPERLSAERDAEMLRWHYGLTNIVARPTAGVAGLDARDFEMGRRTLLEKIHTLQPAIVALVGLTVFDRLHAPSRRRRAATRRAGLQRERLHGARLFVLPNPSGRNTHFTYVEMLRLYRRLARLVGQLESDAHRPSAAHHGDERTILPRRSRSGVRNR
jgi:TDG/mug DNA glycosylase family protein